MLFDSKTFLVFFAIFFVLYHAASRSYRLQNAIALAGSLIFYGWWSKRFLLLLLVSAGIDYVAGVLLGRLEAFSARRRVLAVSMCANLGILFVFKYYDFFASSLLASLHALGLHASLRILHIALPIGISFYTFQSMSYTIDVYRGHAKPELNPITYFTFVAFFPHMVAGPIQRASHLLEQLNRPRRIGVAEVKEAIFLLAFGYFLKLAIADAAAPFADHAFTEQQTNGSLTILGTLAFGIQIYCDFYGYSLIARGAGLLLGITFIWNFRQPYFATSIQDFWRRWHISLSTWLRDYLYISLGGSRKGRARTYLNLFATMLLGGLWHGAAWNFLLWGGLHGAALAVERTYRDLRGERAARLPTPLAWALTMTVVFAGWFLFRCHSWTMISAMTRALARPVWNAQVGRELASLCVLAAPVAALEVWQHVKDPDLAALGLGRVRYAALTGGLLAFAIAMFHRFDYAFIYFQF